MISSAPELHPSLASDACRLKREAKLRWRALRETIAIGRRPAGCRPPHQSRGAVTTPPSPGAPRTSTAVVLNTHVLMGVGRSG
jgi:hypothetical protein